ncbi:MAG TPA: NAD(P)H-dependent oxidoreductase subunit E [Bacteroidota bacterium]|nr:NAD(P)H-dependent oxidoreductase subunit E [Bacteroidota bacterium]
MLTPENLKKVEDLRKRYPTSQAALLPVLWIAQEQEGWISEDMMRFLGGLLNLPYGHILGVVTFYTMYHSKPQGKYHIEVCTNVSCMLRGSDKILETIEHHCGVKPGQNSSDGKWTVSEVECMGACGGAPMLAIGEEYHENLTPELTEKLLSSLK